MQFIPSKKAFLGLEKEDAASPQDAKAIIIPFGLEASVSYGGGTAKGPQAMIDASHEVELFDDEFWCEPFREYGVVTAKPIVIDKKIEKALDQLDKQVDAVLAMGKFPLVFGGEHSLTAGAIRPYARRYKKIAILHIDAHADLRDGYDGEHFSHAAALCRTLDNPNVELYSFGIRNISQSEIPFLEKNKKRIKIYWGREKATWDYKQIAKDFKGKDVYITFDIDGFDSSLMPATGTPEPGGLFWDDAMKLIRTVTDVANKVIGADINELAPKPNLHSCDFIAAKLAYKILSYSLLKKKKKAAKK